MKRQNLLCMIFFLLLVILQASIIFEQNIKGALQQTEFDVIVIGSGMAGMTAANQLAKNGKNVLVLQANDYIGGRMKSKPVTLSDGSIFNFEYGANWIHGNSKQNPLNSLSKQASNVNLILTDDSSIVDYDQQGNEVDDKLDQQWDIYSTIIDEMDQYSNISVYDAIKKINSSKLDDKYFMYTISNDLEFQTSATINDLSAEWGQDDASFPGNDYLVTSRYQVFVEYLSKHDNITVLLNHKVISVTSTGENSSQVTCQNGKTFTSNKIVIAVPLKVLQQQLIQFSPLFPNWKNQALNKLQMGNVCKILIVPKNKINITNQQHYIGVIADDVTKRGSSTFFLNLASLAKIPAYMTFGLGPNADELETMSEANLKQLIANRMTVFAQNDISPGDFDIVRSSWRGNENFGGAYTYAGISATPSDWSNSAKPIFSNGWYFCGQHTNSKYRGTVHGAYLTGKHTAGYIISNVEQSSWKYADRS